MATKGLKDEEDDAGISDHPLVRLDDVTLRKNSTFKFYGKVRGKFGHFEINEIKKF